MPQGWTVFPESTASWITDESVGVLVRVLQVLGVDVRMRVGRSLVVVLVLVLHVRVVVLDVRVHVRGVAVAVLVRVRCLQFVGHVFDVSAHSRESNQSRSDATAWQFVGECSCLGRGIERIAQ